MKQVLSVLEYYSKRNLPRALIISAVMLAAEAAYSALYFRKAPSSLYAAGSVLFFISVAACAALYFALFGPSSKGSGFSYRVRMLQTSEKKVYWLNVIHNILMFLIFWGFQVLALLIAAHVYTSRAGSAVSPQGVMTELCAKSALLYIIPLKDASMAVSHILLTVLLAIGAASGSVRRRYSVFAGLSVTIVIVYVGIMVSAVNTYGRTLHVVIASAIAAFVLGFISVLRSNIIITEHEEAEEAGNEW